MQLLRKITINIALIIATITSVKAQTNDACLWTSIGIEKKLSKSWHLSLEPELRLNNNVQRLNSIILTTSIEYRLFKQIRVGFGYRFTDKYLKNASFSERHRLLADASYKLKISNITAHYRSRIQAELRNYTTSETGSIPHWTWRHKINLSYELQKFEPFISGELFLQLSSAEQQENNGHITASRIALGTEYNFTKHNSAGIYYLIQHEYHIENPCTNYVVGLQYKYQF